MINGRLLFEAGLLAWANSSKMSSPRHCETR
jgi:hypothetical protein